MSNQKDSAAEPTTPLTDRAEQNTSGEMQNNTPPANVERSLLPTQEQGWHPIETAPKDGTTIILACFGQISVVPVVWVSATRWLSNCPPEINCQCCEGNPDREVWLGWKDVCAYEPTHWMPATHPDSTRSSDASKEYVRGLELLLNAERCPNCPDQGWYADGPTDDPEQVQCEWCECYPNSLFKAKQNARALISQQEVKK